MLRASVFTTRAAAVRHAVALALHFGYPRTPLEAELTRVGGGIHGPLAQMLWRWWARIREITQGPLAGRFALILEIDKAAIAPLDGLALPVPARLGGGTVTFTFRGGAVPTANHECDETDPE